MKLSKFHRNTLYVLGGLVIGALLLAYFRFRQDIDAAHDRIAIAGSQVVNTPCGLIEYAVSGTGSPLLIVHGAGGGFDQGLEAGRPLIDRGFQMIAMSRFGYLRTPLPVDASPMAQADAHACLLDALNLQTVFVVGASMGAPSTIQLCIRHPKRCAAMVLLVPMSFSPSMESDPLEKPSAIVQFLANATLKSDLIFWLGTKISRATLTEMLLATPYVEVENASETEQERASRLLDNILPISQRVAGVTNDSSTDLSRYALEQITTPTLVLSTETDLFGTFEHGRYTAEKISGARFLGYPTGGHVWVGRDEEVWPEIAAFLEGVLGR